MHALNLTKLIVVDIFFSQKYVLFLRSKTWPICFYPLSLNLETRYCSESSWGIEKKKLNQDLKKCPNLGLNSRKSPLIKFNI